MDEKGAKIYPENTQILDSLTFTGLLLATQRQRSKILQFQSICALLVIFQLQFYYSHKTVRII